jgi:aryl carrier-like protein
MTVKIEMLYHEIGIKKTGDPLGQRLGKVRDSAFYPDAALIALGLDSATLRLLADYLDEMDRG